MNTLTENTNNEKTLLISISAFCKEYSVGSCLKKSNAYKQKGISVIQVFTYLLQLVYTKKSMYMNILNGSHDASFGKDVVYRILNSPFINWSTFLLSLAVTLITNKLSKLTSEKRMNAYVVDDTLYSRSRSKNVELMAKVHDHSGKGAAFKKGFRMLTVGWTDGATFVPCLFRHLSSEKEKNRYVEINPCIDKRSCGYKTRVQAITPSPKLLIEMLKQASAAGVPAKHVLFDCWFAFPSMMIDISKLGLSVVARVKNSPKIMYMVGDEKKTLSQIYASVKKRRGKSKYLQSVAVKLYNKNNETIDARIVYIRDRNKKKNWIALISTDTSLTEEEIIQLYGKRWDIEVFFKICKSYLNLGSEFHGLSYDAITAHTTVVMTRYIILAIEKRQNEDPRALGELFFHCYDEIKDIQFAQAMGIIFSLLRQVLQETLFLCEEEISRLIDAFIAKLPEYYKSNFLYQKAS